MTTATDTIQAGQSYDLQSHLNDLDAALALWEDRDDTKPQPHVRQAANTAMDAIDAMVRDLYAMRSRLIGEIRASDEAPKSALRTSGCRGGAGRRAAG
jgi:hypothetical protein